MKVGLTLAQRRYDSTDVGPMLDQPALLSGVETRHSHQILLHDQIYLLPWSLNKIVYILSATFPNISTWIKIMLFLFKFQSISLAPNPNHATIASGNGLVRNRWQAIISTNGDPNQWCHTASPGVILGICSANERRRYCVMHPLSDRAHIQNDLCVTRLQRVKWMTNFSIT